MVGAKVYGLRAYLADRGAGPVTRVPAAPGRAPEALIR